MSEMGSWLQQRVRRSRQSSAPSVVMSEAHVGDIFSPHQLRTVSTPSEANIMNGGMPSSLAVTVADATLQVSHTPRGSPSLQRRASVAGTPSPHRRPVMVRRASVQVTNDVPMGTEMAPLTTPQRSGTYARSGLGRMVRQGRPALS